MITHPCDACGTSVSGADVVGFGDAFIAHVRTDHTDWPYPDVALRNYAEATQRLTGRAERLDAIGAIEVHHVDESRIDDFLTFFDHDAFVGNPAWAACYCAEPHLKPRGGELEDEPWTSRRAKMIDLIASGRSHGYLAYVDGRPAGWVNASLRSSYALYALGGAADPADGDVVGVSCFAIAPPYRRHGLADALLTRVVADAGPRGASWIEAYPVTDADDGDAPNFHGPRSLFDRHGFTEVEVGERLTTVRRPATS